MTGLSLRNVGFIGSDYSPLTTLTFINSAVSSGNVTIPTESQPGDIIVYVMSTTTNGATFPAIGNYTAIQESTVSGSSRIAYRVLDTSDIGGSTTIANTNQIVLMLFRPNGIIRTVTSSSFSSQVTTAIPTNQVLPALTINPSPVISLAHYRCSTAITTRGSSLAMTEITGPSTSMYLKYRVDNPVSSIGSNTISQSDNGTNFLQSLHITVA